MTNRILRADEQAAKIYADRLRSGSSTDERLPPKEKDAGSTPVQTTKTTTKKGK